MAKPQAATPVKLLAAILWTGAAALHAAMEELQAEWGEIDFSGADRPFDRTDYYLDEMGADLQRRLVSFTDLVPPESMRTAKLRCNEVEDRLCGERGRRVNLDIGYLDHNKIVLASVKYAGQKIHLGDGVYADLVARYKHGRYQPFEWTFPDFRDGRYDGELAQIRQRYLRQLGQLRMTATRGDGCGGNP
jgi:hypothetical protein